MTKTGNKTKLSNNDISKRDKGMLFNLAYKGSLLPCPTFFECSNIRTDFSDTTFSRYT